MYNPFSSLSDSDWNIIFTDSSNLGLNPLFVGALAVQLQGQQQRPGTYGLMQIPENYLPTLGLNTISVLDPSNNISAGISILAASINKSGGDYLTGAAIYNGGDSKVNPANWTTADKVFLNSVDNTAASAGWQNTFIDPEPGGDAGSSPSSSGVPPDDNLIDSAAAAQSLLSDANGVNYDSLTPGLTVTEGLDEVPWYDDKGILLTNPRVRHFVEPVSFQMFIRNPTSPSSGVVVADSQRNPIVVELNASVKSYSKTGKHVVNKTNTRTGFHITLWGQQADMISGECTTGVFMNQLGLTDFMSTSQYSQELINLINEGYSYDPGTRTVSVKEGAGVQTDGSDGAFRIAAQDAFVEFLSLFKVNGNVWFQTENYTGTLSGSDQDAPGVWSPLAGSSSLQTSARNNDVLTRGYVAMNFQNSVYLGFFKSLNWTMDAEKPFQWQFNFIFQIERTISLLYYPQGFTSVGNSASNDISDVQMTTPNNAELSPVQLPMRAEKRIVPSFVDTSTIQDEIDQGSQAGGLSSGDTPVTNDSFNILASLEPLVDYIEVRIPHRGGAQNADTAAVFNFLINPKTVKIDRNMVDSQSLTRGGWQFGVWGEDLFVINLSGSTPGQYFVNGITDRFQEYSKSYRNLAQLMMVYENNGYWYEGEQLGEGPLAADFTRRIIKMHQDVEVSCQNFIWYGMFDSLTVSQDAEKPFLANFTLTMFVWKERFRPSSPYPNTILNNVQRGHSYTAFAAAGGIINAGSPDTSLLPGSENGVLGVPPGGSLLSPAVSASDNDINLPTTDTSLGDYSGAVGDILNPSPGFFG